MSELPLPYGAWRSTRLRPSRPAPPTPDSPLGRPREVPRRPFEVGLALAAMLPSCGAGSVDSRGCSSVHPGGGLDAALTYRVVPTFALGAEGVVSGFGGERGGPLASAGGGARFFGVVGRLYFADSGRWDPHVSLTLGAGSLALASGQERGDATGLGARVGGGVDVTLGSRLRVGPSASFTHFVAYREEQCQDGVCRSLPAAHGRLLGFATLGLRATVSWGDAM
jgi:hypothetical protein